MLVILCCCSFQSVLYFGCVRLNSTTRKRPGHMRDVTVQKFVYARHTENAPYFRGSFVALNSLHKTKKKTDAYSYCSGILKCSFIVFLCLVIVVLTFYLISDGICVDFVEIFSGLGFFLCVVGNNIKRLWSLKRKALELIRYWVSSSFSILNQLNCL